VTRSSSPFLGLAASLVAMGVFGSDLAGVGSRVGSEAGGRLLDGAPRPQSAIRLRRASPRAASTWPAGEQLPRGHLDGGMQTLHAGDLLGLCRRRWQLPGNGDWKPATRSPQSQPASSDPQQGELVRSSPAAARSRTRGDGRPLGAADLGADYPDLGAAELGAADLWVADGRGPARGGGGRWRASDGSFFLSSGVVHG
jgi:hypothetical protein